MKFKLRKNFNPVRKENTRGFTFVEMLITVTIMGIIFSTAPQFFVYITRFVRINSARVETQRDARVALALINRNIRQASANSVLIDNATGQPPYSRVQFTKIQGTTITYFQSGKELIERIGSRDIVILRNLRFISFFYPRSDNIKLITVTLTTEKDTYEGSAKALQTSVEKVQIMND